MLTAEKSLDLNIFIKLRRISTNVSIRFPEVLSGGTDDIDEDGDERRDVKAPILEPAPKSEGQEGVSERVEGYVGMGQGVSEGVRQRQQGPRLLSYSGWSVLVSCIVLL